MPEPFSTPVSVVIAHKKNVYVQSGLCRGNCGCLNERDGISIGEEIIVNQGKR